MHTAAESPMRKLPAMSEQEIWDLSKRRARQMGIVIEDILNGSLTGSYYNKPLNVAEFCLHEAAHLITLGHHPKDFPALKRKQPKALALVDLVTRSVEAFTHTVQDALEIDTAAITYLAGETMQLWLEPDPIIRSCVKNLSLNQLPSEKEKLVRDVFDFEARISDTHKRQLMANQLVQWFRKKDV